MRKIFQLPSFNVSVIYIAFAAVSIVGIVAMIRKLDSLYYIYVGSARNNGMTLGST